MNDYKSISKLFKALSDPTRLQILDILSCGSICACEILKSLQISQSTLSHHLKVLTDCKLVIARKDGVWTHYSLDKQSINELHLAVDGLTSFKEECICNHLLNVECIDSNIGS